MTRACVVCGRKSKGSRCPTHAREQSLARQLRDRLYGYSRAHWKHVRKERLEYDGYICQLRLPGCTLRATTVHLHPSLEGHHDIATRDDCLSACASCHGTVDAPRATQAA